MIIDWSGRTRFNLASGDHLRVVERTLRHVTDYLGDELVVDDETIPNEIVSLTHEGWLRHWVNIALERSARNTKQLRAMIDYEVPYARPLGSVHFVTQDGMKNIHLFFDEYALAPNVEELNFGNDLSIESEETVLSGQRLAETALSVMTRLFDNDLFDHGYCCPSDQYDAKNLDRSGGGVRAVGLDASKCLPGFYWANYFGAFLRDFIGMDRLKAVPGCRSIRLTSGVLVVNELPPDRWSDPVFLDNECAAVDHLGRHLFFQKGKPMTGTLFPATT